MRLLLSSLFLVAIVTQTYAHSWTACSDYRILSDDDKKLFKPANCLAYPRGWNGGAFGEDRGYDHRPGQTCGPPTPNPYSSGYTDEFPMARYQPGQLVCLAWPPKNHVAATCINGNIPDNGLKVYVSGANPTGDIPAVSSLRLVKDFGKNPAPDALQGFQNCPLFCNNPDKATCTGCFTVPGDLQIGSVHTFVWQWAFNSPADIYSNCWEAEIVGTAPSNPDGTPAIIDGEVADGDAPIPCVTNKDCPSEVCEISGFCMKESGIGAGGAFAIIFALLFVAAVVAAVLLVLYRFKLPDSVPSLGRY